MAAAVRRLIHVEGAALDVLVAARDEPGGGAVCTMHPLEPMDAAVPVIAGIVDADVVCVNPRGVGRSPAPELQGDSTLERMADDLDAVRAALGIDRWVLWGMSGGSMIAQVCACRHPEGVRALVLDSAGPCFAAALGDPECVLSPSFPGRREALGSAGLSPAADVGLVGDLDWQEVPGAGWVLRSQAGAALLVAPSEPSAQMRRVMPHLLAFDARPWLGAISVPTLVLGGSADRVAPAAHLRALHAAVPGSALALIEGAGHVPVTEARDAVAEVVHRFLRRRVWGGSAGPGAYTSES